MVSAIQFKQFFEQNYFNKKRRLKLASADDTTMLEHFMHMQEENLSFFYATDVDEYRCLKKTIWVM